MKIAIPNIKIGDIRKNRWSIASCAIVATVLAMIYFIFITPIIAQKESLESRIKQQKELVAKYEQKLTQSQNIQENIARHEGELKEMQKKLFQGGDPYHNSPLLSEIFSHRRAAPTDRSWTSKPTRCLPARSTVFIRKCICVLIYRQMLTACTIFFPR